MERYGLLGERLGHSYSPLIHGYLGDYPYALFPTPRDALAAFLRAADFRGINVTIPYKEAVLPFLDTISKTAREIGCVNTIVKDGQGKLHGYNTDEYGFLQLVARSRIEIRGKKCLVLGSGGASKTVCAALRALDARAIRVISRNGADNYQNLEKHRDAQVIVNATPVGMYPNNGVSPISLRPFDQCAGVLDLIYNPAKTALCLEAERLGIPSANGLIMLVAQAKRASELFLDTRLPDSLIQEIAGKIERQTQNIALIGMPGSGKTTLGRLLAERLGRRFLDTDAMAAELSGGRDAASFIRSEGEAAFRALETRALREAGRQSGCVIATGGGIVTRPENTDLLRQNARIFFVDRPFDELSTDQDRPLSATREQRLALAKARRPLYESLCDLRVVNRDIHEAAEAILAALDGES